MAMMTIIAFSRRSTSEARKLFREASAPRLSRALMMTFLSILASFNPIQRIRMAMRSLGTKLTVSSVRAWRPSLRMVFSPVTTSLMSLSCIFLRLSEMVRVVLSTAWMVCPNSSLGSVGAVFCVAAAKSAGALSSVCIMVIVRKWRFCFCFCFRYRYRSPGSGRVPTGSGCGYSSGRGGWGWRRGGRGWRGRCR